MMAMSAPHSIYGANNLALGEHNFGAVVEHDDMMLNWQEAQDVSGDPAYKTCYGKIHYLLTLSRDYPLIMHPGQSYKLALELSPNIMKV